MALIIFGFNFFMSDNIDNTVKKQIDSLKSNGIKKMFVHQYALFNGRYNIPYDNDELRCNDLPTVIHIFWLEGEQWSCLRLDKCGLFEIVRLSRTNFGNLMIDDQVDLKKRSSHFTKYKLTKIFNDSVITVSISGTQLNSGKGQTFKSIRKINKTIRQLEDSNTFRRRQ